jgi:hypothetical protein
MLDFALKYVKNLLFIIIIDHITPSLLKRFILMLTQVAKNQFGFATAILWH